MKVAWFDAEKWHEDDIDSGHDIRFFESSIDTSVLDNSFDAISVCSSSEVSREILELVRPEKVLCRSTGFDHVDLDAANDLDVSIQNAQGYGYESVAEYTWSLILSGAKHLDKDIGSNPHQEAGSRGLELKNKVLGVIGAGRIGKEVLRMGTAFDMELYAYDVHKDFEAAEKISFEYIELDDMLSKADVVSVNCPLTDSTKGLISKEEFKLMNGVLFVNTGRGAVIDSHDLVEALKTGSVSRAVLDVVEEQKFELLNNKENIVITPHNAYNTTEAVERRVEITLNNIETSNNSVN